MNETLTTLPFKSTLIKASAGSGKTYQLALRFIALLTLGVAPQRIIALTFTRKAAGEFGMRILKQLAEGAQSPADGEKLLKSLIPIYPSLLMHRETKRAIDEQDIQDRIPELFENPQAFFLQKLQFIIASLSRLNLQTLDSFFQKIVRNLAPELGFHHIELLDETQRKALQKKLLHELLMMKELSSEEIEELSSQLKQSLQSQESDQAELVLEELFANLLQLYTNSPLPQQWGDASLLLDRPLYNEGKVLTLAEAEVLIEHLRHSGFIEIYENKPDKRIEKMRTSLLDKLAQFFIDSSKFDFPKAYHLSQKELLDDLEKGVFVEELYAKKHTHTKDIQYKLFLLISSYCNHFINQAFEETKNSYSLLKKYNDLYDKKVRSQGLFTYEDFKNFLLDDHLEKINPLLIEAKDDLIYRMDGWFDHWLLDEFQDTSIPQWEILSGFIEEVAQDNLERSLFIVGDKKQSIYGWRGGESKLFNILEEQSPWKESLSPLTLSTSWRTASEILDISNHCLADIELKNREIQLWEFDEQRTASARTEGGLTGCVRFCYTGKNTLQESDDDDTDIRYYDPLPDSLSSKKDETPDDIPEAWFSLSKNDLIILTQQIKERSPLERGLTCAVLTKTNKQAKEIYEWLISPEGGGYTVNLEADNLGGTDSPMGVAILHYFQWIDAPEGGNDSPFLQHLRTTPLSGLIESAQSHWVNAQKLYAEEGITGLVHQIKTYLNQTVHLSPFHQQRLSALLRSARTFDRSSSSIKDWIYGIENLLLPREKKENAIQVLTIDKAKGLEYNIVFLPYADKKQFDAKTHYNWYVKKDPHSGKVISRLYATERTAMNTLDSLHQLQTDWEAEQKLAGLCKLYVSITRPQNELVVFLPEIKEKDSDDDEVSTFSYAEILTRYPQDTLNPVDKIMHFFPEYIVRSYGNKNWHHEHPLKKESEKPTPPAYTLAQGNRPTISRTTASSLEDSRVFSQPMAQLFGTKVHHLLESIAWLPESGELPAHLMKNTRETNFVRSCLEVPEIKAIFTRPPHLRQLWRERTLALRENGQDLIGTLDRAYLTEDTLTVIDFKTTALSSDEEFIEVYASSLRAYARLLSSAIPTPPASIKIFILSTHLKKLIAIPS